MLVLKNQQTKKILLWVFLFLFTLSLLTLFTPLTLNYFWLTNSVYILTLFFSFFAATAVTNIFFKNIVKIIPSLIFIPTLLFSWIPSPLGNNFINGWQTVWIGYRQIKHPDTYIAQQMLDAGGLGYKRRVVKVTPIVPLLSCITVIDTTTIGSGWKKVNEDLNPFKWK
jgi:hypothetical protein